MAREKKIARNEGYVKLSEAQIEHMILCYLQSEKIWAFKNPSAGFYSTKLNRFLKHKSPFAINGVSDIVGVFKGKPLFVECKADKGVLTADQKVFMERARKEGAICFVARSVEDVKKELGL